MSIIKNNREKQINDILSIVKLSTLLFVLIIVFKYFFKQYEYIESPTDVNYGLIYIGIVVISLMLIYTIWMFSIKREKVIKKNNYIQHIENITFIGIILAVIFFTGIHESQYKFLFLFIVITTTIQSGIKQGMIIAISSSAIILLIDLIFAPSAPVNAYFENDIILSGVFILTSWPLGFYVKIEGEHIKELENMVNYDGLTGVYNHRYFRDFLRSCVKYSDDVKSSVSLIFIDIDYFKYYNDLYGHQKGDEVLKIIGAILKRSVTDDDIVARYGGEEFGIILPRKTEEEAIKIAEKIRIDIENTYFDGQENQPNGNLTVSLGVSVYPDKASNDIELLKSADDALYKAKFFKKNRVERYVSILDDLKSNIEERHVEVIASIKTLISVINSKDRYTYAHTERVVLYSRLLADELDLSEEDKKTLIYGAYMHDIGKINIPKEVLNKKMPLNDEEWNMVQNHPENGMDIVKCVDSLNNVTPLILHHHEKYNGEGYPGKLKGEDIPFLARVLTIVDSFDAMTSDRPYNKSKTYEEAIKELIRCSGTQFDPDIVKVFIKVIKENKDNFHRI
ncbi:HD-GYP domain-containing protein [Clostridium cylindrosporum]|uniref:Diguanylate cyclase (GGDEF) domain-containing protein n=1 Tax=Clostridium cylindrosporum DSM 605 TaxID=1121307 RepID=A0A0J8DBG9_CLOCY|nr:diguanylate cyclase [Clostridium cylindrosporum]KMT23187.1 diguanylate cyclase (GGDEF) domain-containing protein [Clostridium cylindrosporum DSM 605]